MKMIIKFLLLIVSFSVLMGCKTTIYAVRETDIYIDEKGDICMSEWYLKEVLKAKIKSRD